MNMMSVLFGKDIMIQALIYYYQTETGIFIEDSLEIHRANFWTPLGRWTIFGKC